MSTSPTAANPSLPSLLTSTADAMLWLGDLKAGNDSDGPSAASARLATSVTQKKRAREQLDSGSVSSDSSGGAKPCESLATTKKKRKYRKATHTIRKEEKAKLLKELAVLHSRMEDLKVRALRTCEEDDHNAKQKLFANRVLRRAIQSQQVDLARVHGLMSEYFLFDTQAGSPIHRFIHLDRDKSRRHDLLMGMKSSVLENAERFVRSRFPRLDPLKPMREEHCFEAPNGDYCSTYAAVTQLESATSVRQVFDAVQTFFCNIEISVSERLGSITIREDDDRHVSGLTQNRLVSSTSPSCLLMESNSILFSHCDDDEQRGGGSGIIVSDFVDEDELYPYHPSLRSRRDVSACLHFSTHSRPKRRANGDDADNEQETEKVVVLTHWVNLRLHYPGYNVASSGWRELREHSERWLRTLQLVLHEANFSKAQPLSNFELL